MAAGETLVFTPSPERPTARAYSTQCGRPRVIDTGAWDALSKEGKKKHLAETAAPDPAHWIGKTDVADAVLLAMINTCLTGQTFRTG